LGNNAQPLDITAAQKTATENYLMNLYPIQTLDITWVNTPFQVQSCSVTGVLDDLQQLRSEENAGPDEYYQCVFRQAYETALGGGYAWLVTDDWAEARVSFSVNWWGPEDEMMPNVAHELGHNHGRSHPWTDPDWQPSQASETGCRESYGLGIRSGPFPTAYWHPALIDPSRVIMPPATDLQHCEHDDSNPLPPNTGDIMSYTLPYWVDIYTYNAFAQRIRTVSAFSSSDAKDHSAEKRTLFVSKRDSGEMRVTWGQGALGADDPLSSQTATFTTASGQPLVLPTRPRIGSDGKTHGLSIPLPDSARSQTAQGTLWRGEVVTVVDGQEIRIDLKPLFHP
jgi:hypothetical protein